ncbi:MAG: serine acetyltransferase [Methylophaga sp.]|nr:MAG: serine acetyltransferase [Methylophaga sp.]
MTGFRKQIKNDWVAHGRSAYRAGFRVLLVYRIGNWRMTINNKFIRAPFSVIYRFLERHVRYKYGIELPYTVTMGENVVFEHQHGIVIHGNCVIGDNCIIRQGVTLGNRYLNKPDEAPTLGSDVNVGAGAKILGAVTIGNNATIGANAVVLIDVPEGKAAVGIPAKII